MISLGRMMNLFLVVLAVFCCSVTVGADATFQGLGDVAHFGELSHAASVSADGTVVVGMIRDLTFFNTEAFVWTQSTGLRRLGDLPGGRFSSSAHGVSADGAVVVGVGTVTEDIYDLPRIGDEPEPWTPIKRVLMEKAFRWTESEGMVELKDSNEPLLYDPLTMPLAMDPMYRGRPYTKSAAYDVSADGTVIVGESLGKAARWTLDEEPERLGGQEPHSVMRFSGTARGLSQDGQIIIGSLKRESPWGDDFEDGQAVVWTTGRYIRRGLGHLKGFLGQPYGVAEAISSDGSVVVGYETWQVPGTDDNPYSYNQAFRFDMRDLPEPGVRDFPEQSVVQPLGALFGGSSRANDISADGSIIVGESDGHAFIWDEANGIRNLKYVLETQYGLDLSNWKLTSANSISADGRTIVGDGVYTVYAQLPDGSQWEVFIDSESWIAVLP